MMRSFQYLHIIANPTRKDYFSIIKHWMQRRHCRSLCTMFLHVLAMNVTGETQVRIANQCKNIFATKEASGDFAQINYIIKNKPADFMVISGDDPITLQMIADGADGLISVVANAYPKDYSEMVRLCLAGRYNEALPIHLKYIDIIASMFAEGSPSGVKAYLTEMGLCENHFRLPVWPVSEKHHSKIRELMKKVSSVFLQY